MGKAFDKCVRRGGKTQTIEGKNVHFDIPEGHYRRICVLNEKTTKGQLKQKK